MTRVLTLVFLCFAPFSFVNGQSAAEIKCRLVLFEKTEKDSETLYTFDHKNKKMVETPLSLSVDSNPVPCSIPETRVLNFYATEDGKSPVIASAKIPANIKEAFVFFIADLNKDDQILYQIVVVEDSERAVPVGGAMISNLTSYQTRLTLGEHKYQLPPGKIAAMPQPTSRSENNQSAFSVNYLNNKDWLTVQEGQMRCGPRDRYLIFLHIGKRGLPIMKTYSRSVPFVPPTQ